MKEDNQLRFPYAKNVIKFKHSLIYIIKVTLRILLTNNSIKITIKLEYSVFNQEK
jgi:hypothetical protein